jgi:integrase
MAIKERVKGKKYEVVVYLGRDAKGKERQLSRTVNGTRREAKALEAKLMTEVRDGTVTRQVGTLSDLLDRWMTHITARGRSAWTLRGYQGYIERTIRPALGSRKLGDLRAEHLDSLYDQMLAAGLRPATIRQCHAIISAALQQGLKWGLVNRNVARLASPPTVRREEPSLPLPEQVQAIVSEAERRNPTIAALIVLAALTGARRGELCAVRWSDIDLANRELLIRSSIFDGAGTPVDTGTTKSRRRREVALSEPAVQAIQLQMHRQRARAERFPLVDDPYLFSLSPKGDEPLRPHTATQLFAAVRDELGFAGVTLHTLRHMSVSLQLDAGVPLPVVSAHHGHASPQVTAIVYAHKIASSSRAGAEAVGAAFSTLALPPMTGR